MAPTLLRKILLDISAKAAPSNFPTKDVIENICQSSCGDLRSAINTLQFACLQGNKNYHFLFLIIFRMIIYTNKNNPVELLLGMTRTAVNACKGRLQNTPEKKKRKLESTQPKSSKEINELANIGGRDAPDDFFHTISKALYAKSKTNVTPLVLH